LKHTDNISDDLVEHVFSGQVKKGKASGFHYEGVGDAKGKVVQVTGAENKYGVYKAKVEIDGVGKTAESTFFPKDWTPQEVVDTIEEAFNGKQLVRNKQFLYEGTCKAGIKIEMYVENGIITTAYPVY